MSLLIVQRAMPVSRAILRQALFRSRAVTSTTVTTSASSMMISKRSSSSGNFTPLWTMERAVSADIIHLGLVGIVPIALMMPNPATEFILALSLTAHIHWGIEAVAVDYARPRVVGEFLSKVAIGTVYALSFATLGGLMYFNFTDVGLAHAIRMLWSL
ncbi:succinate dehydrogenase [ubiquinone] cytochrome b small subunit, mitochondrial-like isoform X1 [Varroa jacobsoni]|uniref:succinate dehydrogenase [ubiquinone] cytochrome b small subunit, mitochondrial-like isoform X1 n=1 Tax=Varroa jacobsoni TaxID=62625 RepID=UPI000BF3DB52|nr:succinate dehydrogenase [ubiquinone] cytochrome b small subunit, mitochondrial-like isoform X1 [Varroa jacobsoni]